MRKKFFTSTFMVLALGLGMMCSALAEESVTEAETEKERSHILVAYFSRAGENWEVGVIDKGNTQIMAEMLSESLGADLFKIETVMEYPESYDEMLETATAQREADDRPELSSELTNLDDYDTIFLGYPIWWGGLPMPIYTFLESYDFSGKTIYPFNTHGGSGVAGTDKEIAGIVPDAQVQDGFAISGKTAQTDPETTQEMIDEYLSEIALE